MRPREAVFGSGTKGPPASSTKAVHGHLLGASGAIELAASLVTACSGQPSIRKYP